ncbi:MAG: response regulator, partial [Candidatus Cloacimonadota bacterium]
MKDDCFSHLVQNSSDWIMIINPDGQMIYSSPAGLKLVGPQQIEIIKTQHILEIVHPDFRAQMEEVFADLIGNNGKTVTVELRIKTDFGHYIWIDAVATGLVEDPSVGGIVANVRDISARKQTEFMLERQILYTESLLKAIPDMLFVIAPDGTYADFKAGHGEEPLYPAHKFIGKKYQDVLPKSVAEGIQKAQQKLLSGEPAEPFKYDLWMNDQTHEYEARFSSLGGKMMISLVRDVTQISRAEKSLKHQNRFLKLLTGMSTNLVRSVLENVDEVLSDGLMKIGDYFGADRVYVSELSLDAKSFIKTYEWDRSREAGLRNSEISQKDYPQSFNKILTGDMLILSESLECTADELPEREFFLKAGTRTHVSVPLLSGDQVVGYFGLDFVHSEAKLSEIDRDNLWVLANLLTEVIQKKMIERRLESVSEIQNMLNRIAMHYINLPIEELESSINESLAELAVFTKVDRAYIFEYQWEKGICTNTHEYCAADITAHISDLQAVPLSEIPEWVDTHKLGKAVCIDDVSQLPPNGGVRRLLEPQGVQSLYTLPMMNEGKCIGFVGFDSVRKTYFYSEKERLMLQLFSQLFVNVKNRTSLEKRLISEKDKAEAASRAKSEFLGNMSHEIRTPLNGIIGFTELLVQTSMNQQQAQYTQNVLNSSYNLLSIVNDILDFSKIEAGKLELNPVRTELFELLGNAMDGIRQKAAQKGLDLILDLPRSLPSSVMVDAQRLNQIIKNILDNALKFTSAGEIELKVQCKEETTRQWVLEFSVRDTGIGIGKVQRDRLFKAFSQVDSSITRKYGGTGLGLVISNHLAVLMGSGILLESEEGFGSRFYFDLVFDKLPEDTHDKAPDIVLNRIKKTLLVDDNPRFRELFKRDIAEFGVECVTCESLARARQILAIGESFDLMFLDGDLQDSETPDLIATLSQNNCRAVLLHSGSESANSTDEAKRAGFLLCQTKPLKPGEMVTMLKKLDHDEKEVSVPEPVPVKPGGDHHTRIVVAEDNSLNLSLVRELLRKAVPNLELKEARNGEAAVQLVKEFSPDLVLMDVQMPVMDGVAATQAIREFSDLPVIALTAGALSEERERCLDAGMNDFLTKPVSAVELQDTLYKYLNVSPKAAKVAALYTEDEHFNLEKLRNNLSEDDELMLSLLEMSKSNFPEKLKTLSEQIR